MKISFYYVDIDYINFLKRIEIKNRGYTCVPNITYSNREKFMYGAVLCINGIEYYVPVSSKIKEKEDNLIIRDKKGIPKGSLRFAYMIPVPHSCLSLLSIKDLSNDGRRILISKELAFCRKNDYRIQKQAQKTYDRVINKRNPQLVKNSCDFKLLEKAYIAYCKHYKLPLPQKEAEKADKPDVNNVRSVTSNSANKKRRLK